MATNEDSVAYDPETVTETVEVSKEAANTTTTGTTGTSTATTSSSFSSNEGEHEEEQKQHQEPEEPAQQQETQQLEEDDEEEEYDPTASVSDNEQPATVSAPESNSNNEDGEEEEYDPTSEFPEFSNEESKVSATPSPKVTSASPVPVSVNSPAPATATATAAQTTSASSNTIDPTITQELTKRIFSDPEFLKLSASEQQKKIAEEFTLLSQSKSPVQHQPNVFFQNRNRPATNPDTKVQLGAHRPNIEIPMSLEETGKYNQYLDNEVRYNSRYPFKPNSRLFVGNLPANFSKENLFRIFSVYGNILQVSLKNTYAFVQFDSSSAVEDAIAKEYGIPLYGKDLVLEIAKNSRPETLQQHRQAPATSQTNEFFESRKRSREDPYGASSSSSGSSSRYGQSHKRGRGSLECHIFVKQSADPNYARDVGRTIENAGISTELEFLRPGQSLDKKIKDAAYSGVIGVVLVNKNRTVDCSIYQKTPDGGIRYDEYNSINHNDVISLISREKQNKVKSPAFNQPQPYNQGFNNNLYQQQQQQVPAPAAVPQTQQLLQQLQNFSPEQLQAIVSAAGLQQGGAPPTAAPLPLQYQQPSYNQYQQQQPANNGVDLSALLGKLQPQQPQQQQGYNPQQYGNYGGNQGYQPQPPQNQQQGGQQQQTGTPSVESLLATLSNFSKS